VMRIGLVTQWYDPEQGSAAVPGAIARALVGFGHDVHVLTGFPNYPTGRLYPGYRLARYRYEFREGVHVHRVPLIPSHDRSAIRRAGNYLSFAVSAAVRPGLLRCVDVWLVYSSPATAALPALAALAAFGRPYVLLVQDLWPDSVVESGFLSGGRGLEIVARGLHRFCGSVYRRAAGIAVTAPSMVDVLCDRGVPESKIDVVPNWVDEQLFRPVPRDEALRRELGLSGFVVMYAGSLGDLQGLDVAVEAVGLVSDLSDVSLVFVGSGVAEPRLRALAARGAGTVVFLGQQPVDRMPALLALGDAQLVSLRDLPLFRSTLPSKIQAALAVGRPVVGAVSGDARALIDSSGAGLTVRQGDPVALAAAIREMHAMSAGERERRGRCGRQYYLDHLAESVGGKSLIKMLEQAVHDATGPRERAGARG
jgi:glycosyltransferase involved in cell wall biosynthesis